MEPWLLISQPKQTQEKNIIVLGHTILPHETHTTRSLLMLSSANYKIDNCAQISLFSNLPDAQSCKAGINYVCECGNCCVCAWCVHAYCSLVRANFGMMCRGFLFTVPVFFFYHLFRLQPIQDHPQPLFSRVSFRSAHCGGDFVHKLQRFGAQFCNDLAGIGE